MLNKDNLILVLVLVNNSGSSQSDDINMADSKMTKATTNPATSQARNHSQSNPTSFTSTARSASIYDRRH